MHSPGQKYNTIMLMYPCLQDLKRPILTLHGTGVLLARYRASGTRPRMCARHGSRSARRSPRFPGSGGSLDLKYISAIGPLSRSALKNPSVRKNENPPRRSHSPYSGGLDPPLRSCSTDSHIWASCCLNRQPALEAEPVPRIAAPAVHHP